MSCEGQQELLAYVKHLDKNSGHQGSGGLPRLAVFHTCCHTSLLKELRAIHAMPWDRTAGSSHLVSSGPCHLHLLPLLISMCLFSAANHKWEYPSILKFCESFWYIIKSEGGHGDSPHRGHGYCFKARQCI